MTTRKLATPGALLMFAGTFLLYWGLKQFGIIGGSQVTTTNAPIPLSPISGRTA